jgi:putative membrane-bound dehydrogenase-like protein
MIGCGLLGLLVMASGSAFAQETAPATPNNLVSAPVADTVAVSVNAQSNALAVHSGDHICLVGNELGERMQHHNFFETLLYSRLADEKLVVRNLCFPGDEPFERIRSQNFGEPDAHLKHSQASVILYFFGFNESFAGESGLPKFKEQMTRLVKETSQKKFNGKDHPRIVLVSPIAFENTGDRNLPDGSEHNPRLESYTAALKAVADETGVGFVDLFTPTQRIFEESSARLTLNGAHLNEDGYKALAPIFVDALIGKGPHEINEKLRAEIADKNFHWWHRYRAVNGYSIYGSRGTAGFDGTYRNRDVMEREREILDQMTANRDERIWAIAQGKTVAEKVNDDNTLPFITPKTNVGLPNDPNVEKGKLGSLDYLPAAEQKKLFKLAPGYEINLVASEQEFPELANPVSLTFDNQGRLWVSTMASYPHWKPKTEMDDKVLIFEDHDHDGQADECKIFARGLHQPTGFELGMNGAYIAQQPDVLFIQDTDGDDQEDTRIRKLVGFDTADSHHGIAAFQWGPGGNLYMNEGTFKFSQVESPYGLTRLHEAGIWKYHPRTEKFGVHVNFAFANPWGHVFDRWGQDFIADASPGFSYWAAPISGRIDYPLKHPGGSQHRRIAAETGGDPNYEHTTFYPKRTRPSAGCELVSSRHFPDDVQGNFLLTNCIGDRAVINHTIREEGSGFVGTEVTPIISCDDGNFRPVDVEFAPDGSLYIIDWHNALIGHLQHNLRDPSRDHSHGRIWRVTYPARPLLTPPKIAGEPIPALLELLKEPEDRTRYRVRRELAQRDSDEVETAVHTWIDSLDKNDPDFEHHMLEALWLHQTHNLVEPELLDQLLHAKDHRARAAAVRVLSFWVDDLQNPLELLRKQIADPHPRVRLEAVRALSFLRGDEAIEVALEVLEQDMDDYLQYTLDETMRALEQ